MGNTGSPRAPSNARGNLLIAFLLVVVVVVARNLVSMDARPDRTGPKRTGPDWTGRWVERERGLIRRRLSDARECLSPDSNPPNWGCGDGARERKKILGVVLRDRSIEGGRERASESARLTR